ncbi:MAG: hypothetical protein KJ066_01825 [Acidobacteria bacterium]|nr:hypothetical protein [Acidobacteriota bacterium]
MDSPRGRDAGFAGDVPTARRGRAVVDLGRVGTLAALVFVGNACPSGGVAIGEASVDGFGARRRGAAGVGALAAPALPAAEGDRRPFGGASALGDGTSTVVGIGAGSVPSTTFLARGRGEETRRVDAVFLDITSLVRERLACAGSTGPGTSG